MKLKTTRKNANLSAINLDGILGENNISLKGLPIRSSLKAGDPGYTQGGGNGSTSCSSTTETRTDPTNSKNSQTRTCQKCDSYTSTGQYIGTSTTCGNWS